MPAPSWEDYATMPEPHSMNAEEAIIGACLRDQSCVGDAIESVKMEDFYSFAHRQIFISIKNVYHRGEGVDLVTVGEDLARRKALRDAGGAHALAKLHFDVLTSANITRHCELVREKAILRRLIYYSKKLMADSYAEANPFELLSELEKSLAKLSSFNHSPSSEHIRSILPETIEEIKAMKNGVQPGLATGYLDLDKMTGGLHRSELIILAARPSIGKTSLSLGIADNVSRRNEGVLFVSLEMSGKMLAVRLLSAAAKIDGHRLRLGLIREDDQGRLEVAAQSLSEQSLWLFDAPGAKIGTIASAARRLSMSNPLRLIVIDYLQLIEPDTRSGLSRNDQVTVISQRCKELAREFDVPVLVLSQLSRSVEQQEREPRLSDLRDSGSIEQDADVIMFLHRNKDGDTRLLLRKQRNGPCGDVDLVFRNAFTRFENAAPEVQEPMAWSGAPTDF